MSGTNVIIVESLGDITNKDLHQEEVKEAVANELRVGGTVVTAITTVTVVEPGKVVLRNTTMVFDYSH